MTIFIHIGLHKTASSYLQSLFVSNSELLKKNGIIYPASNEFQIAGHQKPQLKYPLGSKKGNHSLFLYAAASPHFSEYYGVKLNDLDPVEFSDQATSSILILAKLAKQEVNHIIFSGEELSNSNFGDGKSAALFLKKLSAVESDLAIVAMIREPISFSSSLAQQFLKSGNTIDNIRKHYIPLYRRRIEPWTDAADELRLPFIFINISDRLNISIEEKFLTATVNKSIEIIQELDYSNISPNRSLSQNQAKILSSFNQIFLNRSSSEAYSARNHILKCFNKSFEEQKFSLKGDYFSTHFLKLEHDIEWLRQVSERFNGDKCDYSNQLDHFEDQAYDHELSAYQARQIALLLYQSHIRRVII